MPLLIDQRDLIDIAVGVGIFSSAMSLVGWLFAQATSHEEFYTKTVQFAKTSSSSSSTTSPEDVLPCDSSIDYDDEDEKSEADACPASSESSSTQRCNATTQTRRRRTAQRKIQS
jgi:hypothetical protein